MLAVLLWIGAAALTWAAIADGKTIFGILAGFVGYIALSWSTRHIREVIREERRHRQVIIIQQRMMHVTERQAQPGGYVRHSQESTE